MWYTTGILCGVLLAALAGSPSADVDCDGVDDLISSALSLGTFLTPTTYTVTAWILSAGFAFADDFCWSNGPFLMDSSEGLAVGRGGTTGTGSACVAHYDGITRTVLSPLAEGWHHLAARFAAGTLDLVVDGVPVGTPVSAGALADVSGTLHLCGQVDGHSPDKIAHVKVYPVALTTAQLERMARSRLVEVSGPTPSASWPLNDCADGTSGHGVSFKDRSGNARHLTGQHGANVAGLTCRANGHLSHPWGIQ